VKEILLLRHGPTSWNAEGRIQGRADPPLSAAGRARVRSWAIPAACREARWLTSPLRRARETADLLAPGRASLVPALIEMDWGAFEGRTLAAIRAEDPAGMADNEARGLDFRPPGGESPRDVRRRLTALLRNLPAGRAVAVTHKGVIRAGISLAMGWDMRTKPPLRVDPDGGLLLQVGQDGLPTAAAVVDLTDAVRCVP
jgi:probable phosphoglycerate mutase